VATLPKILCVDDEQHVLDALQRVLRNDFIVLRALSGDEGLEVLTKNRDCAVILSDQKMPQMTGVEFLQRAKALAPEATRAILSGHIDVEQLSEAINSAEIHRFLLKPWDNEVLRLQMLEALQTHLRLVERQELHRLSITDPITNLTNHRYFQERLQKEVHDSQTHNQPLSLVMIDVDHFKSFNDHYGHPEGDRLLSEVAQRLMQQFPEKGLASRYGGEEFAVILPRMGAQEAFAQAELMRKRMEESPFVGPYGRPAYVTLSLGVSELGGNTLTAPQLIAEADKSLYQAKRQGRNQTVVASA
jgi:diguanylate cyclase (GGDEF)-like protein